jgi:hypothetical protein
MPTKNAAPENPKENLPERLKLAEIAKLSKPESVAGLTGKLEEKDAALKGLAEKQNDERKKEMATVAQTSVDARLELIHAMAA